MFLDKSIQLGVGLDTKVIFGSFQRWEWHTQVVLLLMSYSLNHNFDIWQLAKDEKIIEPRLTKMSLTHTVKKELWLIHKCERVDTV